MPHSSPKTALITGAAHRVGRAIAIGLAQAGWNAAITYNVSRDEAEETVASIEKLGRKAIAIKADFTRPQKSAPAVKEAVHKRLGKIHLLVNNASIYLPGDDPDDARRMWAVHVETPLLLARAFAADLRSGGRIVNMLDAMVQTPRPEYAAYCASKAGLWNLTLSLARQFAPHATVNGIAPGVVLWPKGYPKNLQQKYLRRVPLRQAGNPRQVVQCVLFFCQQDYVTGQVVVLDGGRSLV